MPLAVSLPRLVRILDGKFGLGHKLRPRLRRVTGARNLSGVPHSCKSDTGFDSASYGRNLTGAFCSFTSMAPVLAITGMVARTAL
jgi:hypothetical protein